MASWSEIEHAAPELASRAKGFLEGRVHRTIATLRRDGSPRISGTELRFDHGELWFGSMWRSNKALDLLRDPRFSLHSGSEDPPDWTGDATVSGSALEADAAQIEQIFGQAPPGRSHLFRADIAELTLVTLAESGDHLIIESWTTARGVRRRTR